MVKISNEGSIFDHKMLMMSFQPIILNKSKRVSTYFKLNTSLLEDNHTNTIIKFIWNLCYEEWKGPYMRWKEAMGLVASLFSFRGEKIAMERRYKETHIRKKLEKFDIGAPRNYSPQQEYNKLI